MISILITILFSYLFATFFGHVIHWAMHQSWTGFLNKAHMDHHMKQYPPEDFVSNEYRSSGNSSTPKYFLILALPVIIGPIVLCILGIVPLFVVLTILFMEGFMAFFSDRFHEWIHIKDHWVTRVPGLNKLFARWTKLHYWHHVDMNKNFGIFIFHWDHIFGTFWKGK